MQGEKITETETPKNTLKKTETPSPFPAPAR
jgi:hypothetical protein